MGDALSTFLDGNLYTTSNIKEFSEKQTPKQKKASEKYQERAHKAGNMAVLAAHGQPAEGGGLHR